MIVKPDCEISTAEAYRGIVPAKAPFDLHQLAELPVEEWRTCVYNDFEKRILSQYPEINRTKESLYEAGALYASMTGSGSAVYGVFTKGVEIPKNLKGKFVWSEEESEVNK